jgi:hypothetical protein
LYDSNWKPAPPERAGYLELGHQFEWAFLLSHAVEKGFPKRYLAIGERLLNYGMKVAYDKEEGGIFSRLDAQGAVVRGPKGWWKQCSPPCPRNTPNSGRRLAATDAVDLAFARQVHGSMVTKISQPALSARSSREPFFLPARPASGTVWHS